MLWLVEKLCSSSLQQQTAMRLPNIQPVDCVLPMCRTISRLMVDILCEEAVTAQRCWENWDLARLSLERYLYMPICLMSLALFWARLVSFCRILSHFQIFDCRKEDREKSSCLGDIINCCGKYV